MYTWLSTLAKEFTTAAHIMQSSSNESSTLVSFNIQMHISCHSFHVRISQIY